MIAPAIGSTNAYWTAARPSLRSAPTSSTTASGYMAIRCIQHSRHGTKSRISEK